MPLALASNEGLGITVLEVAMSEATRVNLTSPSGDTIEVEWTGERLLVFMTSGDRSPGLGATLVVYDSHVAGLIGQGLLEEEGTPQAR